MRTGRCNNDAVASAEETSPYVELDRAAWAALSPETDSPLTEDEIAQLQGLGDSLDLGEVEQVYLPLSRLLSKYVKSAGRLHREQAAFLGHRQPPRTPFVIGVAGSVAVGKSTTARVLQQMLAHWPEHPNVALVTTDGFLHPNAELERRGILHRKGFPESYDRRALLRFVTEVKSGAPVVRAPVYSHTRYDIVPGEFIEVRRPDILIVEGLNVLQTGPRLMVSDLFDFSLYVDARIEDIEKWYIERFLELRTTSFSNPASHFAHYADLSDKAARLAAREIWNSVNRPNLVENILPTRPRATLVLRKNSDHSIQRLRLRKI